MPTHPMFILLAFRNCPPIFSNMTDCWGFTGIEHVVYLVCSESGVQIIAGEGQIYFQLFRFSFKFSAKKLKGLRFTWLGPDSRAIRVGV